MTTYLDPALRNYLAESAKTPARAWMFPMLMHPKTALEFPPGCGRDALNAALALTSIG